MRWPERPRALVAHPLWHLGFRPFFLGGATFAVLAVLLWLGALHGYLPRWQPTGGSLAWHRHEMPFGFGGAIIAGFLLTAVQNWSGRPGLYGPPLAALFVLWLAARLAWLSGAALGLCIALQLPFLPLLAVLLGHQLWAVRQRHNYPIVLVLLLMAACDGLTLYGLALGEDALQRRGALAALWLIAALMGVIGGRVIPFFTERGLGRMQATPPRPRLDRLGLICSLAAAGLTAGGLALAPRLWLAPLFGLIAVLHGLRLYHWYDRRIWQVPLLWSLHLAYAWLLLAALGMTLWHAGWLAQVGPATHALTVGAMGGLILAMLARVSLGHTGRPLQPPATMSWAFSALQLAALARVFLAPELPIPGLALSGLCWMLGFALFLGRYSRMLCTPRVDGQPR